jgi:hypothetical protein
MATTIKIVTREGDPFDEIIKDLKADTQEVKASLKSLGEQTALMMVAIITNDKKRPQNGEPLALENHIKSEDITDGWGVGNIEELEQYAPYWAAVNYGSSHMVGRRVPDGHFSPIEAQPDPSFFRQDRWVVGGGDPSVKGDGKYSFIVGKPIPPMNYIEQTMDWLNEKLDALVSRR